MSEDLKRKLLYGGYETLASFILGFIGAVLADGVFEVIDLTLAQAGLIGGSVAALEVIEEVAKDTRDRFREKRKGESG